MKIRDIVPGVTVNGPGERITIVIPGCDKRCPGCFNPELHTSRDSDEISSTDAITWFNTVAYEVGVPAKAAITGGEPLKYIDDPQYVDFLEAVSKACDGDIVLFTGYDIHELVRIPARVISMFSIVVYGPYIKEQKCDKGLRGSSNQGFLILDPKYSNAQLENFPHGVQVSPNGKVLGFLNLFDDGD